MNAVETILKLEDDRRCAIVDNKEFQEENKNLKYTVDSLTEELYRVYVGLLKRYVHQDSNSVAYVRPIIHSALDEIIIITDKNMLVKVLQSISEWDEAEVMRVVNQYFNRLVEEGKANVKRD